MIFNIENSDNVIPFYYNVDDFKSLLNLVFDTDYYSEWESNILQYNEIDVIAELKNDWYPLTRKTAGYNIVRDLFANYKSQKKINVANLDELVIYQYLINLHGETNVKCQVKLFGNKAYDFVVNLDGKNYFIEFDGLDHFIPVSQYNSNDKIIEKKNLLSSRKEKFQEHLTKHKAVEQGYGNSNSELIFWPYWIKKCKRNFNIIINKNTTSQGIGAIYSSDRHFNEFPWDGTDESNNISSAQLILDYNSQFNIPENLIGSFYSQNTILLKKTEQEKKRLLIPNGCENEEQWLPE